MRRGIAILVASFAIGAVTLALARTWTDDSGTYQVEADFVGFKDGQVQLKKQDGLVVEVPLSRLSAADRRFVESELRRQREAANKAEETAAANEEQTGALGEASSSADWPQWRGPRRDGVSTETGLLDEWSGDGPRLLWSVRGLGRGYSSVSVADGSIYTMGNRDGGEKLIALDAEDGRVRWATPAGNGRDCNCTPTVDGDLVFGLGREGDLVCAETATGKVVWQKSFARDFGGKMMSGWGYSESPLVDGDRLICTPGGQRAMIAALDKKTGRAVWQTPMQDGGGAGYSSIVISHGAGVKQYVTIVGRGAISVAADDGRPLWHYAKIANGTANIPTPIIKDDYVLCSTGYDDGGTALLKLEGARGRVTPREVYYFRANELQNHHGGMVLIGDHVFMGHGHNNGFPMCFELLTGRKTWGRERGEGSGSAAIVAADGHLYFRYQSGVMALIEANPREYKVKGTFRIASRNGESWPHPVIAGGRLYLRDQDQLHCYDIAQK